MSSSEPSIETNAATNTEPSGGPGDELTYEEARAELVEVVQRLENGGTTLEESLALWERGEALATRCQSWLDGARERLDAVVEAEGPDEE